MTTRMLFGLFLKPVTQRTKCSSVLGPWTLITSIGCSVCKCDIFQKFSCWGHNTIFNWLEKEERNVLFNDALNTFYSYMTGDICLMTTNIMRRNPLLPLHGLLFLISSKGSFICTIPQTGYHIQWSLWNTGWNKK